MVNIQQSDANAQNTIPSKKGSRDISAFPVPRVWTAKQVAARFNKSVAWLHSHLPCLNQHGFPKRDNVLGGFDSVGVEAWFDRRAGISNASSIEDQMLEAIRGNC